MRRLFCLFCFVLLALNSATSLLRGASHGRLVKEWDVLVGPVPEGHAFYRAAVCPDGTYYLTDALGRLVKISSLGSVLDDAQIPEISSSIATACNKSSGFLAAGSGSIVLVQTDDQGRLKVIRAISTPTVRNARTLTALASGGYMILGSKGTTASIFSLDAGGALHASYEYGSPGAPYSLAHASNGTTTWDPISQSLLYVPENPYVFTKYDPLRGLLGSAGRNDPSFRAPDPGTGMNPGDRVMKVAYLPNGDLLSQVVKRAVTFSSKVGENVMHTSSFIELFDSSLNLKTTAIPVEGFGFLQGVDSSGGIYFNLISKQGGIHVVKARLSTD